MHLQISKCLKPKKKKKNFETKKSPIASTQIGCTQNLQKFFSVKILKWTNKGCPLIQLCCWCPVIKKAHKMYLTISRLQSSVFVNKMQDVRCHIKNGVVWKEKAWGKDWWVFQCLGLLIATSLMILIINWCGPQMVGFAIFSDTHCAYYAQIKCQLKRFKRKLKDPNENLMLNFNWIEEQ